MDLGSIFDRRPKFHELDLIKCSGKTVRVFEKGARKWERIAIRLHFDSDMITQIRLDCRHTFQACQMTFTEWLDGKDGLRTPITWKTVIEALKEAGLGELADSLNKILLLLEKHPGTHTEIEKKIPLLKHMVPDMSLEDYEKLQTRLYADSDAMTEKFGRMFNDFFQSLTTQRISIKKIVATLKAFGAFSPVYKGENHPLLRDKLDKLDLGRADIDDIKLITLDYCSFFNYQLFSSLVASLGTTTDKEQFEKYEAEFNEYAKRRIYECPSELGELNTMNAILTVTLDSHYEDYTLNQLRLLEAKLSKILNVSCLKLCRVTSGCLQLMFQLPWFVQKEIFPLSQEQEEKLADLRVIRVVCGYYQFTAKQIQAPTQMEQEPLPKEEEAEIVSASRLQHEFSWAATKEKLYQIGSQTYIQIEKTSETRPESTGVYIQQSREQQCVISIKASLAGQYEFPENFYLVSGVYWIRNEPQFLQFSKSMTVEIEHCAKSENIHRLSFAMHNMEKTSELPFTFRQADGDFSSNNSYGTITLDSLSGGIGIAVIQEGSDDRKYIAIPFYQRQTSSTYEIHLTVTWNTKAHLTGAKNQYENTGFKLGKEQPIEFESDELKLDIPTEGITLVDGWKITPLTTEAITKTKVDSYKTDREFNKCCLSATFITTAWEVKIPKLHYNLTIMGAREPHNKVTIDIPESDYKQTELHSLQSQKRSAPETYQGPPPKRRMITDSEEEPGKARLDTEPAPPYFKSGRGTPF